MVPSRAILGVDDLDDTEIRSVLDSARSHLGRRWASGPSFVMAAMFLTSSLRTRVGFTTAATRLGGVAVDVMEARWSDGMSSRESFDHMLRTVSGMVDLVVVRTPQRLDRELVRQAAAAPIVNGGDAVEHPTQALIDLFAIEQQRGRWSDLVIALCGDMSARSARSLVKVFERLPPKRLVVVAPSSRSLPLDGLAPRLRELTEQRDALDVPDVDVLSMVGLPEGVGDARLDADARRHFTFSGSVAASMKPDAVVLSPMPVIDEIAPDAWTDHRVCVFQQSDEAVAVRMAVIELLLDRR